MDESFSSYALIFVVVFGPMLVWWLIEWIEAPGITKRTKLLISACPCGDPTHCGVK